MQPNKTTRSLAASDFSVKRQNKKWPEGTARRRKLQICLTLGVFRFTAVNLTTLGEAKTTCRLNCNDILNLKAEQHKIPSLKTPSLVENTHMVLEETCYKYFIDI